MKTPPEDVEAVMRAMIEGRNDEIYYCGDSGEANKSSSTFDDPPLFFEFHYFVKTPTTLRPYTIDELIAMMPFAVTRGPNTYAVEWVHASMVRVLGEWYTLSQLPESFTHVDGSPLGVEE